MRIFVINLEKDTHKKAEFIKNFNKFNLDYEFINGVYGGGLSDSELERLVYDYKNSFLTKGEIGCSLSHLEIYQKMINEDIHHALILEDDAVFDDEFKIYLDEIDRFLNQNNNFEIVCLMQIAIRYFKNLKINFGAINLYKISRATRTHGYIITQKAAKELLNLNRPVILEADMWLQFCELCGIKIYCLNKNIIDTSDPDGINSSIGMSERVEVGKEKSIKRKTLVKQVGGMKYMLRRAYYRFLNKIYKSHLVEKE